MNTDADLAQCQFLRRRTRVEPLGLLRRSGRSTGLRGDMVAFDATLLPPRRLHTGQCAFLQGETFRNVYVVRAGSFKTSMLNRDGRDQVIRFCFPGDLMGLDGLGGGAFASTATALEDSDVCPVPVTSLRDTARRDNRLHQVLCHYMGQEIVREHAKILLIGSAGVPGRLASFLLEVSDGMRARGYSPIEFHLHMSRADIGSYLCLSLETISRAFSTFKQQDLLEVNKRHIVIRSLEGLRQVRDKESA